MMNSLVVDDDDEWGDNHVNIFTTYIRLYVMDHVCNVCDVRDVSDGSNFIRRVAQKGMLQLYLTRLAFVFVGALDKSLVRPLSLFNQEKNTRRRTRQTTTGKIYVSLKALSPSAVN